MDAMIFIVLGAGLAIGLGAIGSAIGEGYIAMSAMSALGRQPGSSQKILRLMIIGQAITETAAIFALVLNKADNQIQNKKLTYSKILFN